MGVFDGMVQQTYDSNDASNLPDSVGDIAGITDELFTVELLIKEEKGHNW